MLHRSIVRVIEGREIRLDRGRESQRTGDTAVGPRTLTLLSMVECDSADQMAGHGILKCLGACRRVSQNSRDLVVAGVMV